MRYRKAILFTGIVALAILYGFYKSSPVIAQSLENGGFKLVSNAKNKDEIYKRILVRYGEDINRDIKLNEYLTAKDQKYLALSFWCDLETSGKSFFVNLDNYKKYCTISISDYLIDEEIKKINWEEKEDLMYIDEEEFSLKKQEYKQLFTKKKIDWQNDKENYKRWIRWCKDQKYLKNDTINLSMVKSNCLKNS